MKTMEQHTKLLCGLVVSLFLLSCSTTRKAQATEKTTTKYERQTETVFVHDTTVADGQTTTFVTHDTINGKPVVITRTTTRTKTVRTGGQIKTVTDTVFVHDTATKTEKGNIIPSKENKAEKHARNGLLIALFVLLAMAAAGFALYYAGCFRPFVRKIRKIFANISANFITFAKWFISIHDRLKDCFNSDKKS